MTTFGTSAFATWALIGLLCGQPWNDPSARIAQAKKELEPRLLTLPAGQHPTADFLAALEKQTGNVVVDRRAMKSMASAPLDFNKIPFWQALDRFCAVAGCGYSAFGSEGGVALIDGGKRSPQVNYHGIARTSVKRIAVAQDFDTGLATCIIHLDVAWEPRFQPFYLGVGAVQATYAASDGKAQRLQAPSRGQLPVAGQSASEIELQLAAPPRQAPALASLEGTLTFLGPSKMLTFRFPALKANAALEQEEVSVRVVNVKEGLDRWLIDVQIDNPEGTPSFDTYQSWLANNRIELVRGEGAKRQVWLPEPNESIAESARRANITYSFAATPAKGKAADWTMVYRTPGRIVELAVPYRFKNVPLR